MKLDEGRGGGTSHALDRQSSHDKFEHRNQIDLNRERSVSNLKVGPTRETCISVTWTKLRVCVCLYRHMNVCGGIAYPYMTKHIRIDKRMCI